MFEYLGIKNDIVNDEHEAYIVEWIVEWVMSGLKLRLDKAE